MKEVKTFESKICLGLQEGYSGIIHSLDEVKQICQQYCNKVGLGLTITSTNFIYVDGQEEGCIIGLINYPRFPRTENEIFGHAEELAKIFIDKFKQERISIVCSDKTYMIESE